MRRRKRFERARNGGYNVALTKDERALLGELAPQLDLVIDSAESTDDLRRLFPNAYLSDERAEESYRAATRDALAEHHRHALETLSESSDKTHLADEEIDSWLHAINVLRLVIGTKLDISEDSTEPLQDAPEYQNWLCYQYLSFLESEIIDALSESLPEQGTAGTGEELPADPWGEPPGGLRWDGTPQPNIGGGR
jgi:hypothetical protein